MDAKELAALEAKMGDPEAWGPDPRYIERVEREVESLRAENGRLHVAVEAAYQLGYNAGVDEARAGIAPD